MKLHTKLVWLELIGGLFGWVWLLATGAVVLFIIMALASDWSWWNVAGAVGVGAVGKWLARGFRDNQTRVAYIAERVDEGMTPKEAHGDWFNRYMNE